jgi:hypothetical protein
MNSNTREELRHLLSTSGTMAAFCITAATLFSTMSKVAEGKTVVDNMFVLSAMLFLLCTYCIFWALRTAENRFSIVLTRAAEVLFAIALTAMVAAGFIMTYTLW